MRQYRIVTDGSCDLPPEFCRAHHITVLPLYYSIASAVPEAYPGGRAFPLGQFYEMLRKGTSVRTSAPSIEDCKNALRPLLAAGNDLLYAGLSARLSGMYNVMRLAAMELSEEFPSRQIVILDGRSGSLGVSLIVRALSDARENGSSFETAQALGASLCRRICSQFTVSDLYHLKRGGRIGSGAAAVGTVLQIMPMLHVTPEGSIAACGKVRGRKNALRALADAIGAQAAPGTAAAVGHCNAPEDAAFVREILRRKYGIRDVRLAEIGPVLGAHAGPGAVAGFCFTAE